MKETLVSYKQLEDKVFERIYDKYLKEKETPSPSISGEDSKKPKEASPPSTSGVVGASPLPVYKIPFIPIKPKKENPSSINSPSTPSKKSQDSSGEGERKPSVSHGDLIGIGLIVFMIALPFLLLADWKSIIQRIKGKHKSEYPTYNPFQGR